MKFMPILLFLSIAIIACETIPPNESKGQNTFSKKENFNIKTTIIENLNSEYDSIRLKAQYEILKLGDKLNQENSISFEKFKVQLEFAKYFNLNENQKIVVLGINFDENLFEIIFLQKDTLKKQWILNSHYSEFTRYTIQPKDLYFDTLNNLLEFSVEQTWFSEGSLTHQLFYKVTTDSLYKVLCLNSSGGDDMELAVYKEDSCNFILPTFFSSKIDSFSEEKIHFNYSFLVEIDSECDIESNAKDTLLLDSTIITYRWNENKKQFCPNWASLNKFDSTQFFSLTNWSTLEGFTKAFKNYCKENKTHKPKTVTFIESAFID